MDIALELCSLRSASWALKPLAVPYANFGGPQTLNLYTYVENSPLNRIDADGHTQPTGSGQGYNQDASGRMPVKADCPAWDVCPPQPPDPDKATNAARNTCQNQNCSVKVVGDTGKDNGELGPPIHSCRA